MTKADLVLLSALLAQSSISPVNVPMASMALLREHGDDIAMAALRVCLCLFGDDVERLISIREDLDKLIAAHRESN